jgi:hypothetical protein
MPRPLQFILDLAAVLAVLGLIHVYAFGILPALF